METIEKVFKALVDFCSGLSGNEAFARAGEFREYLAKVVQDNPKYSGKYFFDACSEEEFSRLESLIKEAGNNFPRSALLFVGRSKQCADFPLGARDPRF